ncbi:hypothetical protein PHYPSEUDO_000954 [Phytophthora pseudosyringae]|uniref:Uncharacterized protein n=1 Tax=Phytophthora pseudosyringae TaxID=221518 RepID=A0A8T1VWR4_9STRA|nr:hypothetical protein PHYPSEUDO_000954 [Phytophthora pseudosyringae]
MADISPATSANGASLSLEEVTKMIQRMREEQASLFEQQREVIIQQVLESIQRSGAIPAAMSASRTIKKTSAKEMPSSPTSRLEQNLHNLVHHSLAESGLDYPHVHSTARDAKVQSAKGYSNSEVVERATRTKQVILSRREVEAGEDSNGSSAQPDSNRVHEHSEEDDQHAVTASSHGPSSLLSHSPLRTKDATIRKTRNSDARKRRHHRQNKSTTASWSRAHMEQIDDDYSEFVDPVDAAFAAIRKKVDLRTLAILDRSKVLLGQVRQHSSTDGRTSFVEKLRQRHANVEQSSHSGPTNKNDEDVNENGGDNQHVDATDEVQSGTSIELACEESDEVTGGKTPRVSPNDIRCDLELLKPPSKAPDNDNEWENELARQILTIYATSVKAKALEKANSTSPDKLQNANQDAAGRREISEKQRLQNAGKARPANGRGVALKTSCSLPAIGRSSGFKLTKQQHRTSSSTAAVQYSWEPSQLREDGKVIINMPKVPRPIWFAGTGAVKAVWCALADGFAQLRPQHAVAGSSTASVSMCDHRLCEEVRQLEAKRKFAQCITTLETLLVALVRARGVDELETKLWKQLVVTCNAFASRCIDYQKFPAGLQLMKQAEHLIDNSILVDGTMRMELLAYLYDTYAHYYYKRRKPHAGLQYIMKAHEIHSRQSSWSHLAKCRLHIANLLSFQIKHTEAMKYMASILEMIEENKLEETSEGGGGGGSAQKLCLAAVCYNNLAVEQLHMRAFEAASVSSANAQRLAKLCLSYSNRWLAQFQATSDCIALAIATLMEDTNANKSPLADCRALSVAEDR